MKLWSPRGARQGLDACAWLFDLLISPGQSSHFFAISQKTAKPVFSLSVLDCPCTLRLVCFMPLGFCAPGKPAWLLERGSFFLVKAC